MPVGDAVPGAATEQDISARILQVATELFAAKGFAATSTREIVEAAGVTKPMLYYYFGNKLGLCRAVVAHVQQVTEATLEGALASVGSPEHTLVEFLHAAFELRRRHPDFVRLVFSSLHGPEDEIEGLDLRRFAEKMREPLQRMAHLAAEAGLIATTSQPLFARMLHGVLYAWLVLPPDEGGGELTHDLAEQIVQRLLGGFSAP